MGRKQSSEQKREEKIPLTPQILLTIVYGLDNSTELGGDLASLLGKKIKELSNDDIHLLSTNHQECEFKYVRSGLMMMQRHKVEAPVSFAMSYDFDDVFAIVDNVHKHWNSKNQGGIHDPGGKIVNDIQKKCKKLEVSENERNLVISDETR